MNEINVRLRQEQLRGLQEYVKDIDKDITLILQSLQWDRKHLLQSKQMVTCKYDLNHRIPADNVKEHEEKCYLKSQNYVPGDCFFLEPLDPNAATVVKLSAENINDIINYAAKTDPCFKRNGSESGDPGQAPLTLGRLQATHSVDERRALYDAVAAAAPPPAPHDMSYRDPALDDRAAISARRESRSDELLALRDARRRRARHRGAAHDGYQQELRGLISAQMELFTGKWNGEDANTKPEVTIDESDDGRRCGHDSDLRDHKRNGGRAKYFNPYRTEHIESREDKRDKSREDKRKEYERQNMRKEYKRESKEDKRREYERENREDKRKEYKYDKKYKERNKIYERIDRRRQRQYDKEYLEIKQEKNDYPADRRKGEERRYDYKNRRQETDRSSSRDNKKCQKQEERHYKLKSAERRRGRSRDIAYDSNYKNDIDCSYLKIKKEPP